MPEAGDAVVGISAYQKTLKMRVKNSAELQAQPGERLHQGTRQQNRDRGAEVDCLHLGF